MGAHHGGMSDLPPDAQPGPPPDPDQHPTQAMPAHPPGPAVTGPAVTGPAVTGPAAPAAAASTPPKERLRDRLWSLRALIAVALASVIVGGLGGAALANVSKGGEDCRMGRFQRGGPPGMMNGGPGQRNGGRQGQFPDRRRFGQQGEGGGQPRQPLSPAPSPALPKQTD